jgi:oxaloacetate decarboxylase alpha subunit
MAGGHILSFEAPAPRELVELFYNCIVRTGALNRGQLTSNSFDQIERIFPWIVPVFRNLGIQIVFALSYTISPRHTDEYYAQKTRELLAFKPDAIYVKDQGGLLTVDRVRTLIPAIIGAADGVPVELHSHCTTGIAPLVYLEALRLGVRTLHTAVPPLANGPSQPSVINMANNARIMGYAPQIDEGIVRSVSERLTAIAKQERLPLGAPLEYDHAQYIHQVPGGVISNLKYQLAEMRIADRLDAVLEECVHVRRDLGYPIMITPHSQFVVTQAALNVAAGERYKLVIDEVIQFAQGMYGTDSGYTWMDQNLKDRLLAMPRAAELSVQRRPKVTIKDLRDRLGGPGVTDEEFVLRFIMKGDQEIKAMRAAGPPKQYLGARLPLLNLVEELNKHKSVRYVSLQRGRVSLLLQKRAMS